MTSKVLEFLSESGGTNFTSAPRPPVYGEENELTSNDGGTSTRSSGSHKSQLSNKSHTSTKSMGSNRGESPAVTPRRLHKDKSFLSRNGMNEDDMAPLGYNPEGSESSSPPFTENSPPSYMKWAENLNFLLDDLHGVQLFRTFLEQEGIGSYSLDFWFACQGLKTFTSDIANVIRVIHKKYIKSDKLPCIGDVIKKAIHDKIHNRSALDKDIFEEAQTEVENDMRNNTYPLFIKSDLYVQYVQKGGESPKSSNTSSGSVTRPVSVGPLPTLLEDQELKTEDVSMSSFCTGPPPSSKSLNRTNQGDVCSGAKKIANEPYSFSVPFAPRTPVPHPYHVSYAPVSAQDSEIQSLSSDALTDDTRSLTDGSVDNERIWKKHRRTMKKRAEQNRESANQAVFIPRTQRAPKDSNVAEVNPKQFAAMLIERLEKVLREQQKDEKFQESMNRVVFLESDVEDMEMSMDRTVDRSLDRLDHTMERSLIDRSMDRSMDRSIDRSLERSIASSVTRNMSTSMPPLLSSSVIDDDNPNSILEDHVSRIWESSNQQTPIRSPGRQSPTPNKKSSSRGYVSKSTSLPGHSLPSTLPSSSHKSVPKKRPDYHSSFDSGMGEDKPSSVETHRHIHHHHHHHHSNRDKKQILELEAQQHVWSDGRNTSQSDRGRQPRKAPRKQSDTGSNIDSGVSMIESIPSTATPNVLDPSAEKVMNWMRDNSRDNEYSSKGATGSTDTERSSSHKRYRSGQPATTPLVSHKQGSTKKSSNHGSSRSASVERATILQPWMNHSAGQALPSQPFVQDPNMPLPTPPNTTVQLEEAKRRLEESRMPVKSKSFAGVSTKDKKATVFPSQSSSQIKGAIPTTNTVPSDLDLASETKTNQSEKKSGKKSSSSSANTSGSGPTANNLTPVAATSPEGEIIVGYFFCGEPIPYRHIIHSQSFTLLQFKHLIGRRGNFKYFFKKRSNEFESGVVYEEIQDDNEILPLWEGNKVVAKVEKVD